MTPPDPPAVTVVNEAGASPIVLLCEHAANFIPARYARLGLTEADLERHIAYDIGAAAVARQLAAQLDAVLLLSGYSRLLIDCNRPLAASSSIPPRSEDTDIPGNVGLDAAERAARDALCFAPFRTTDADRLDARLQAGRPTILIGMHSFTPVYLGVARIWHAGFLYARAEKLGRALSDGLRAARGSISFTISSLRLIFSLFARRSSRISSHFLSKASCSSCVIASFEVVATSCLYLADSVLKTPWRSFRWGATSSCTPGAIPPKARNSSILALITARSSGMYFEGKLSVFRKNTYFTSRSDLMWMSRLSGVLILT